MDPSRIKANGPWVFVKILEPELIHGYRKLASGLWVPGRTEEDKLGYTKAEVLSLGPGTFEDRKEQTGWKTLRGVVEPGDVVLVRWYLTELNKASIWDDEHCFIHQDDVLGGFDRAEIVSAA